MQHDLFRHADDICILHVSAETLCSQCCAMFDVPVKLYLSFTILLQKNCTCFDLALGSARALALLVQTMWTIKQPK